jgi:hypothetical protein
MEKTIQYIDHNPSQEAARRKMASLNPVQIGHPETSNESK